jgi:hypothetical protein
MSPQLQSLEQIRNLAGGELSLRARLGYVALLLVAVSMTVVIASLWITEAGLPPRTQWAFGVMTLMGLCWSAFAAWALASRRPLYARDRVIAGRMAVIFASLFVAAAVTAVVRATGPAAVAALGAGIAMLVLAVHVLVDARRRFASLAARRRELETTLTARG